MKIKLIAIAKDEAAYLPYWIFHHLHFGFDAIEIHINRCQDNSVEVLNKIVDKYPQVSYRSADWVDIAHHEVRRFIQSIVYAESYWRIKNEGEFTHICFLDIDEFWTPLDLKTTIHQCINSSQQFSTLSFSWNNFLSDAAPFSLMPDSFLVEASDHVKSVINLKSDMEAMKIHLPTFKKNNHFFGHYMSDGRPFICSSNQVQALDSKERMIDRQFVIVHRMYRSELEYIALLSKSKLNSSDTFKFNRRGYNVAHPFKKKINFNQEKYNQYSDEYYKFIDLIQLHKDLHSAQEMVIKHSEQVIDLLEKGPKAFDKKDWAKIRTIFYGVTEDRVVKALNKFPIINTAPSDKTPVTESLLTRFRSRIRAIFNF